MLYQLLLFKHLSQDQKNLCFTCHARRRQLERSFMDNFKIDFEVRDTSESEKMEFGIFCDRVVDELKEICGPEFRIKKMEVMKNNAVKMCGVSISEVESKIAPTIYLESFYKEYMEGDKNIQEIVNGILKVYSSNRNPGFFGIDEFMNFESVQNKIGFRLVNKARNEKMLSGIPHRDFLDLAVIYVVYVGEKESFGSVTVKNEHIKVWGVGEEELYATAMENMNELVNPRICGITDIIEKDIFGYDVLPMYVLTNRSGCYAAAGILSPDILREFAEERAVNLILLPSSVHEMIILPEYEEMDINELRGMVLSVNRSVVHDEDYLSDEVYRYDLKNNMISVVR